MNERLTEGKRPNSRHFFFGPSQSWTIPMVCGVAVQLNRHLPGVFLIASKLPGVASTYELHDFLVREFTPNQATLAPFAGESILIFICLSLGTVCSTFHILHCCSIDFWTLLSRDRILSLTTSGSLQRLHRERKSNKQNGSLKPVSSFCAWKNMIWYWRRFFGHATGVTAKWTFSCTCLIFSTKEFSNMWRKFWNCRYISEHCFIPKLLFFSQRIVRFRSSAKNTHLLQHLDSAPAKK